MDARSAKILWPREHGTYGELLFPLLSVLVLGHPGRTAWGVTLLAIAGFLAHEGFSVLVGTRGVRAKQRARHDAWRSLAIFGGLAAIGAAWAWPAMTRDALTGVGLAVGLSLFAATVAWRGREHTLAGELLAALTLSSWCTPVGVAGGLSVPAAAALWVIWTGVFAMATCAVHLVIARTARRPTTLVGALGWVCGAATLAALWMFIAAGHLPTSTIATLVPALAAFVVLATVPVRATHLRRLGWSVIGISLVTLAAMVVVWR